MSPSNEHQKETKVHKDQVFVIISEKENSGALPSGSDNVPNLDCKDIIIEELKKVSALLYLFLSWQFLSIHLTISFLVIYSGKWIIEGKKSGFRRKVTDYNTIASNEFENIELREKIEGLEKEEPIVLVRGIIYIFSNFACV